MSTTSLLGLCSAALVGLGLAGLILNRTRLRRIVSCNILASGVFLVFGVVAMRGGADGLRADPVPQAMVITGLVVAFAGTALAAALSARVAEADAEAEAEADSSPPGTSDSAGGGDAPVSAPREGGR